MGYGVYEDGNRWAGYMVPAECDMPDCHESIDRGLYFKCETHEIWDDEADEPIELEGCGLFFCSAHLIEESGHEKATPKPDALEWRRWQLYHESWDEWRQHNPDIVKQIISELNGGDASKERTLLLSVTHEDGFSDVVDAVLDDGDKLQTLLLAGWVVAETHMPPADDPRFDDLVELVKQQWRELHEEF
jgi:hypothetical protein